MNSFPAKSFTRYCIKNTLFFGGNKRILPKLKHAMATIAVNLLLDSNRKESNSVGKYYLISVLQKLFWQMTFVFSRESHLFANEDERAASST